MVTGGAKSKGRAAGAGGAEVGGERLRGAVPRETLDPCSRPFLVPPTPLSLVRRHGRWAR
jgi:hypothetical protein